ncbi:transaldolase [Parvularcula bermudensis HTCC2503]|uniref:Probable transaldolase n=1 Tax=Parvularcula bermudensis (strain ATCC BAA-594 / HTCC2503 / KCTC 12087) TaxID=314260 RepID=E0TBR6_PARBH|nr:fructose-6-phosphate aldolase [Parvularcula bermudensis]ADM09787.1 transaldolase [Parvularcula bermudensis HTCC2503]
MKIFIDTADTGELKEAFATGLVDGVTTNPSLIAKSGRDFKEVTAAICEMTEGPVSAEVASTEAATMVKEGRILADIAQNVVVKLPLTWDGLKACQDLSEDGINTNVTLCFTPNQAWLAAKAGATYISPFVGRLDDLGADGMELIGDIRALYDAQGYETEILAASIRGPHHVSQAALLGADVATIPPKVFWQLLNHPLTDRGLDAFVKDWASTGQSIL